MRPLSSWYIVITFEWDAQHTVLTQSIADSLSHVNFTQKRQSNVKIIDIGTRFLTYLLP